MLGSIWKKRKKKKGERKAQLSPIPPKIRVSYVYLNFKYLNNFDWLDNSANGTRFSPPGTSISSYDFSRYIPPVDDLVNSVAVEKPIESPLIPQCPEIQIRVKPEPGHVGRRIFRLIKGHERRPFCKTAGSWKTLRCTPVDGHSGADAPGHPRTRPATLETEKIFTFTGLPPLQSNSKFAFLRWDPVCTCATIWKNRTSEISCSPFAHVTLKLNHTGCTTRFVRLDTMKYDCKIRNGTSDLVFWVFVVNV